MSYDPNQPPDPSQQPPYGQPQPPYGQPPSQYGQQWGQQPQPPYEQPPYEQPQQPPYQQQWPQQPPQGSAPTQYAGPAYGAQPVPGYMPPPQQQRKSRRGLWIALAIIGGVLLLGCAICGIASVAGVGFFAKNVAGPAIIVNEYYTAVKNQDYNTAFSYISTNLTASNGQNLTQQLYTTAAQALDTVKGKVTNFSVGSVSTNNNVANVTVSVTRGGGTPYDVHLQLQQVNGTWKITSYDNI